MEVAEVCVVEEEREESNKVRRERREVREEVRLVRKAVVEKR